MKRAMVVLLAVILLCGCQSGQDSGGQIGAEYRTGTNALILNFLPNSPPSEIFDTDELHIGLEVRNKGAHMVTDGTIYFSGFDPQVFSGSSQQGFARNAISLGQLEGKSFYNPEGGYAVYSLSERINSLDVTSYSPTILATACYSYATEASTDICIDSDPYSTQIKEKACSVQDISLSGGQGGPIEVTKLDVNPARNEVRLTFHIRNSGGGLVYDPGMVAQCSPYSTQGIRLDAKNTIRVDYVKVGMGNDITGSCQPGRELKLVDGQALLMCRYALPSQQGAYTTPVTIKLSYGYRSSISRSIKIIQTPN